MDDIQAGVTALRDGRYAAIFERLYGKDKSTLNAQSARYANLLQSFGDKFSRDKGACFSSPGRTEIGGNHTDHNHGRVLAGAVNLDNIAVATPNHTDVVRVSSAGYSDFAVDLNDLSINEKDFFTPQSLVRGIAARLKMLGYAIGGFDAAIDGCVPKGSGLSSSASFEALVGVIFSHLFNGGKLDPTQNAMIGQYAENNFFGKPCGLMDQMACSVGGLVSIDFKDPDHPLTKKINFDFSTSGFSLAITDTRGSHADLNDAYASLPKEMKSVAAQLGGKVLRDTTLEKVVEAAPSIRKSVGDRSILRALHFFQENERVSAQAAALERNDFRAFLQLTIDSGYSSYMYNQNVYASPSEQSLSLGLAWSYLLLQGQGAWRVHGGGFAGTIQAFVPAALLGKYIASMEHLFGEGACHNLFIRNDGAIAVI